MSEEVIGEGEAPQVSERVQVRYGEEEEEEEREERERDLHATARDICAQTAECGMGLFVFS